MIWQKTSNNLSSKHFKHDLKTGLNNAVIGIISTLMSILTFAQKGASKGFWKALLHSSVYAAKIAEYKAKLECSMHAFGVSVFVTS